MAYNYVATHLKEILNIPIPMSHPTNPSSSVHASLTCQNDLSAAQTDYSILPNNCTISVPLSSTDSLLKIKASETINEGIESANPPFAKMERLITYNWDMIENANLIAVHFRKPVIAYTLKSQKNRLSSSFASNDLGSNQMVRIMNYENKNRCLAKGLYHYQIADLSFAINSTTESNNDMKLAIADKGGYLYIYDVVEEDHGDLNAMKTFEIHGIVNSNDAFNYVSLAWCPYIPNDDDDEDIEGDSGLKLALSCDKRVELFAIDVIQDKLKQIDKVEVDRDTLKMISGCYQNIEKAHDLPVFSLSISNDLTSVCTFGLDDKIKFYQIYLNGSSDNTKMFYAWNPEDLQPNDHMSAFYFLDDFEYLSQNSDHSIWHHALVGTTNGHISIYDLKNWKPRQSIKLICDGSKKFSYKIDFTAHTLIAINDNIAFLIQIRFPYDKVELDDDDDLFESSQTDDDSENEHPYISKVTRFQIYNTPLRSFTVKKCNSDVYVFWITEQSLQMFDIDLSQVIADIRPSNEVQQQQRPNISLNENDNSLVVINETQSTFNTYMNTLENRPLVDISSPKPSTNLAAINQIPSNLLSHFPSQSSQLFENMNRPESPESKEVEDIFTPAGPCTSQSQAFNFLENHAEDSAFSKLNPESTCQFPSKLPNVWNDVNIQSHFVHLREEIKRELQNHESKYDESLKQLEREFNRKLEDNFNMVHYNESANIARLELEMKEMRKELKAACKIRNEEFNKVIERLVNRLMLEMNIIVSKGLNELMRQLDREVRSVINSFEKRVG